MKLHLEAKTQPETIIKNYLEENASEVLAEKINNGVAITKDGKQLISRKTLSGFMKFANEEAKKKAEKGASSACIEDSVVFGWAIHYFEEDSILGDLFNEDGTPYKPQKAAPKPTSAPAKAVEPKKPEKPVEAQFSLFDMMQEPPTLEQEDDDEPEEIFEPAKENETKEEPLPSVPASTVAPTEEKHWIDDKTYVDELGEVHEVEPVKEKDPLDEYDAEVLCVLNELLGDILDLG